MNFKTLTERVGNRLSTWLWLTNAAGFCLIAVQTISLKLWLTAIPLLLILPLPTCLYFLGNFLLNGRKEQENAVSAYAVSWSWTAVSILNILMLLTVPDTVAGLDGTPLRRLLCILGDAVLMPLVLYSVNRPIAKVRIFGLAKINLPKRLGIKMPEEEIEPGDVVLCRDKEDGTEVILPRKDRFLHMLILGATGTGKTSQIILPLLNQDLRNHGVGVTVIEPKGDLAEKAYAMAQYYGRPALYFNPVLESCPTFNPLYGSETEVIENVVTTFKMLSADSEQYFQDMNEQLLRNSLKMLKRLFGNDATLLQLSRLITNAGGFYKECVIQFRKAAANDAIRAENDDIMAYFADYYDPKKTKTFENTSGIRSQVAKIVSNKYLRRVLNPADGKGSDIDFDRHLEEGTVICISTAQGSLRELGRFLGYFIILNFQSSTFRRPGDENTRRDHFLYIDEFQSYSNPGFADMLTQGRSYRVASHLATQNRALIGMGSGREGKNFIELVSTNARNIILFPGCNYNDAKYYSDQFGEVDTVDIGVSSSQSALGIGQLSTQKDTFKIDEDTEARLTPTDIMQRPFGEVTFSIIRHNSVCPARVGKISYIDKDLNTYLDGMVAENKALLTMGLNPNKIRQPDKHGEIPPTFNIGMVMEDYERLQEQLRMEASHTEASAGDSYDDRKYRRYRSDVDHTHGDGEEEAESTIRPAGPTNIADGRRRNAAGRFVRESHDDFEDDDFTAERPRKGIPPGGGGPAAQGGAELPKAVPAKPADPDGDDDDFL